MSKIIQRKSLDDISRTPFLYASRGLPSRYTGNDLDSDIYRNELSSRIIIPGEPVQEIFNSLPFSFIDNTKLPALERDEDGFILSVYDEWIRYLLRKNGLEKPILSIYFQDHQKARDWTSLQEPVWNELKFPESRPTGGHMKASVGTINLWRHIKLQSILNNSENYHYSPPFYYEHTSYHYPFFSFSTVVFWVDRGKHSSHQDRLLLGE